MAAVDVPPQKEGEPYLKLFSTYEEMSRVTGQKHSHGYFDPQTNTVVATLDSCAHEIGHFRDFKSGRMRMVDLQATPLARAQGRMRNEIVAILFAFQRVPSNPNLLPYEREFLEWFQFMLSRKRLESWMRPEVVQKRLPDWSLSDLQDVAEFLIKEDSEWFEKLEYIFRHYLQDAHVTVTYRPKNRA